MAKVVTPEMLEVLASMWAEGQSQIAIAARLKIDRTAVQYWLETTLKPQWRERINVTAEEEIAKVDHLEKIAWERFHASQARGGQVVEKHEPIDEEDREAGSKKAAKAIKAAGGNTKLVERVRTKFKRDGSKAWLDVVQWCISERAKLLGLYKQPPSQEPLDARNDPAKAREMLLAKIATFREATAPNAN